MIRAKKRLDHEYESFPLDYIKVNFKKETFLEWHFLFIGQNGTPFEGGEYHGTIVFPENYPLCPPSTQIITPNGRFQTDESVCFSISDFHPENWKPAYTMSAFLQGVYSFMMSETTDTVGSLVMDEEEIRELAKKSREFNKSDDSYIEMFKDENNETIKCPLFTSTASNPLMKVPSERSQSDHNYFRGELMTHRPRRSLSVPVRKSDRDSRVGNEKEFTSIASDPLTKVPSERSQVDHSNTKDKLVTCPPKRYTARSHITKLQIAESHAPNSSSAHRTSPIKPMSHSRPPKPLAKDGLCKSTSKNRSINSSSLHSPSSVKGKESHTSKLLERTLPEGSRFKCSYKSATHVSQHPERLDNVTVQSSDYPVNDIARDNYDRDTSEISQPNKELSSEKSRGRQSKKTSSNRSMNNSSLHSRTSLTENTLPQTTRFDMSTHFSEESKNVSVHKVDHTPNPLTDRENHILQDSNARIDKYSARVMDLENSNLPPSDYPSEPHSQVDPKVLHEISSTVKSNITSSVKDTVSSNPSKPQMSPPYFPNSSTANRTSSVTGRNQFHSLNSPASARFNDSKTPHLTTSSATNEFFQGPTVARSAFRPPLNSSNSSTAHPTSPIAHIKPSQSLTTAKDGLIENTNSNKSMCSSSLLSPTSLNKSTILPETTRDNRSNHFLERSENVSIHQTGHTPNSLAQDQSVITSVAPDSSEEFSSKRSQPKLSTLTSADVVAVPFSGKLKDPVSSNSTKLQMSRTFVPNSSTAHQSSSMINTSSPNSPTSAKDRLIQNTTRDNSSTHLSGKSETVSISKTDHTLSSLTYYQDGNPPIRPDSSKEFFSDEWSVNLPKGITPLPSQVLSEVSQEDTLTMNSNLTFLGSLKDTVSSNIDKLQEFTSNSPIPSTTHQTSSMISKNSSYFSTTNEERLSQNASGNKSMNSSTVPSPTSLDKSTLSQTTSYDRSIHLSEESKNISGHKVDYTTNTTDNGLPSQFLINLTCPTDVDDVPFSDMDSDSFIHTLQESNARFDKDPTKFRVIDPELLHSQVLCEVPHEKSPSMNLNVIPPDNLKETANLRATEPQMSPPFSPNSSTEYHTSSMTEDRIPISPAAHKVNASYSSNSSATDNPIINPSVFLNKPQNYVATRIIRHKPPSPSPSPSRSPSSFLVNNLKDPKWNSSMKSCGSSSSVTSRSHPIKLKQQPEYSYSPKISNSFETTKEFQRNEYKPLLFSVIKLFNFIIAIIRIFVSLIILFYRKMRS